MRNEVDYLRVKNEDGDDDDDDNDAP